MSIEKLSKIQARILKFNDENNGFSALEKTLYIIAGIACASVIITICTLTITGNDASTVKSKSSAGISKVFNAD